MKKAWRRRSSAGWAARAVTDLCDEKQAWTTGWRRWRAHSDAHFKEAVAEAAALHAHDELFSKHIEPEPAPEDPVEWAMAEASDDEDATLVPGAPLEPCRQLRRLHLRCPTWNGLGVRRWTALTPPKNCHLHHISASLSVVSRVGYPVCPGPHPCFHVLTTSPRHPDSDKPFFFLRWPQKSVDTRLFLRSALNVREM